MTIEDRREIVLPGPVVEADVLDAVGRWAAASGFRTIRPSDDRIDLSRGSQTKLRLLGGAFIAPTSLPLTASVTVRTDGPTAVVSVVVADDVRVGSRLFMRGRYERLVAETAATLSGLVGGS